MATKGIKAKKAQKTGKIDITFLTILLILLTIGLIMLFSASYAYSLQYFNNSYRFISRQLLFAGVGLLCMWFFATRDYRIWKKWTWAIYLVTVGALVIVLTPLVSDGTGVDRWIYIGPIGFQPSEIAKFAIILTYSSLIATNYKQMNKWGFLGLLAGVLGVVCLLILLQPHYSAIILIGAIAIVLLIVGGLPKKLMIIGGILIAVAVAVFIAVGGVGYTGERLKYWFDPWSDPQGKGFQTIQSLLAIGSGGILGRGIGQSRQKYLWVPEPHNDFIFSIVCEELGLIGAMVIILLFCLLVWRGFTIAMHAPDKFGSLLAVGLTFQVGLQALINICVVTNALPNTGISLPFFSYGGTSLILLLSQMGIVLSISRHSSLQKA